MGSNFLQVTKPQNRIQTKYQSKVKNEQGDSEYRRRFHREITMMNTMRNMAK